MLSRLVLTLCLITCMFATGQQASPVSNESIFSYDKNLPLGLREAEAEKVPDATVHNISYPSPKGGLVTAYLVVPDGKGPFGAIEFVHWGQGNRTEFLSEALLYARAGVISLLLDAPHARPDFHKSPSFIDDPQRERDVFVQLVIDCRRGFDLLLSRPDVDPKKLLYVGHSLGATWGGTLAGVDKRPRAYLLMGGLPNVSDFSGDDSFSKEVRQQYSPDQIRKYAEVIGPLNPENFVSRAAPRRIYFQFARWDRYITRASATRYEAAASVPKFARTYNTSHEFNDLQSRCDRATWIASELSLTRNLTARACGSLAGATPALLTRPE